MSYDYYMCEQIGTKDYRIVKFNGSEVITTHLLKYTKSNNYIYCDCSGFKYGKDKSNHSHCLIMKDFINNKENGIVYTLENGSIQKYSLLSNNFERFVNDNTNV